MKKIIIFGIIALVMASIGLAAHACDPGANACGDTDCDSIFIVGTQSWTSTFANTCDGINSGNGYPAAYVYDALHSNCNQYGNDGDCVTYVDYTYDYVTLNCPSYEANNNITVTSANCQDVQGYGTDPNTIFNFSDPFFTGNYPVVQTEAIPEGSNLTTIFVIVIAALVIGAVVLKKK